MAAPKKTQKKTPKKTEKGSPPRKRAAPARARSAPAGAVNAVSPLRGMAIEDWIALKTSGWQSAAVRSMVAVVKRAAPTSTASIKWGQPVFEENGPFAFIKPAKAHLSFGFWRGSEVVDPKGILERGERMGHFKIRSAAQLDEGALAAMVKDAVRLNRLKGSPTQR